MADKNSNQAERDTLAITLKEAGLRPTPQRLAICKYLAETREHPTARQIFEDLQDEMPSLSQATVYNTLEMLVEMGLVHDLGDAGDGTTHYDCDLTPHINLICTRCQRIEDLYDETLDEVGRNIEARTGYHVLGARLAYYGLCRECRQGES